MGEFDLTIKGITRTVSIPFTVRRQNNSTLYKGSFEINRLDFGLGEKSAILDERVKIHISATG
ncbi:MAG TPA: YceI family protein [Ohtaekwangia sp.]|nr:YceI family protein [Ohtaekwangia sp.]